MIPVPVLPLPWLQWIAMTPSFVPTYLLLYFLNIDTSRNQYERVCSNMGLDGQAICNPLLCCRKGCSRIVCCSHLLSGSSLCVRFRGISRYLQYYSCKAFPLFMWLERPLQSDVMKYRSGQGSYPKTAWGVWDQPRAIWSLLTCTLKNTEINYHTFCSINAIDDLML